MLCSAAVRSRVGWSEGAGWKATSIGAHHSAAENILKQDYSDDITLANAIKLVIKVTAAGSKKNGAEGISQLKLELRSQIYSDW